MVYSVTLNPCLDYLYTLEALRLGGTNRAAEENISVGGKGINFSTVLAGLGVENTAMGFVAGFVGDEILRRLELMGIRAEFVRLDSGNSRINFKLRTDSETEVNGIGPEIPKEKLQEFFKNLDRLNDGDKLLLAGSVPKSLPAGIYREIAGRLSQKKIDLLVDCTGEALLDVLENRPFLIKPNHCELGELFGVEINSAKDAEKYAVKLREKGARNVLVSMAEKGATLAAEDGNTYFCAAPAGKPVNSVGAGDSMVAGFLAGWLESGEYFYSLKMGVSAGSASAFSQGLAEKAEIMKIFKDLREI